MSHDVQQVSVKLFFADGASIDGDDIIRAFHRWIQESALADELLIDVTDYSHVAEGPGVLLIAHDAQYGVGDAGGRLGLEYRKKRDQPGPFADKLRDALRRALAASLLLEQDPALAGRLRFDTGELQIRVHNRLLAPNNDDTFRAVRPALELLLEQLYAGSAGTLAREGNAGELFRVRAQANERPPLQAMLDRLAPA